MKKTNKKDIIIFSIIFLISILIFIPFLKGHYSTDTYGIINKGYSNYAIKYSLKDGRIIMALIGIIADMTQVNINAYITILTFLAIFCSCISIVLLKNIINNYKKIDNKLSEFFVILISYYTIFNFMFIENMHFVECFVMALSILFYMISANSLVKKEKYYIPKTLIFLMFGIISYQGTISMYLISLVVFSIIKNIKKKEVIKDLIAGSIIGIIGILIEIGLINIVELIFPVNQVRISGLNQMIDNIIILCKNCKTILIVTGNVFINYWYLIFILITFLASLLKVKIEKLNKNILVEQIIIILLSIAFGLLITVVHTTGIWSARIRYSMGTTIGFLFLHLFCKTDLLNLKNKLNIVLITILIVYGYINTVNYICIMNNTVEVNNRDRIECFKIYDYILEYEQTNNIEVKKIAVVVGDLSNTYRAYYKDLNYKGAALSWRATKTAWSIEGIIELYTNRDFEKIELTKEQEYEYRKNVDDEKGYLCIEDILIVTSHIN